MPHETLLVATTGIPFLEVALPTFARASVGEVEEDDGVSLIVALLVSSGDLPDDHKLLRRRVGHGCHDAGAGARRSYMSSCTRVISTVAISVIQNKKNIPCLAKVRRVAYLVRRLLVIDGDENTARVAELVLMRIDACHRPGDTRIDAEEGIALIVRLEELANRADGHDDTGCGRREDTPKVMRLCDRVEV